MGLTYQEPIEHHGKRCHWCEHIRPNHHPRCAVMDHMRHVQEHRVWARWMRGELDPQHSLEDREWLARHVRQERAKAQKKRQAEARAELERLEAVRRSTYVPCEDPNCGYFTCEDDPHHHPSCDLQDLTGLEQLS